MLRSLPELSFRLRGIVSGFTPQPHRDSRPCYPEPVSNLPVTPALQAKPPDFDHVLGREFLERTDRNSSCLQVNQHSGLGNSVSAGKDGAASTLLVVAYQTRQLLVQQLANLHLPARPWRPPRLSPSFALRERSSLLQLDPCRTGVRVTSQQLRRVMSRDICKARTHGCGFGSLSFLGWWVVRGQIVGSESKWWLACTAPGSVADGPRSAVGDDPGTRVCPPSPGQGVRAPQCPPLDRGRPAASAAREARRTRCIGPGSGRQDPRVLLILTNPGHESGLHPIIPT